MNGFTSIGSTLILFGLAGILLLSYKYLDNSTKRLNKFDKNVEDDGCPYELMECKKCEKKYFHIPSEYGPNCKECGEQLTKEEFDEKKYQEYLERKNMKHYLQCINCRVIYPRFEFNKDIINTGCLNCGERLEETNKPKDGHWAWPGITRATIPVDSWKKY